MTGRWVLITGCDSGIGALAVSQLSATGAKVAAFTLTEAGVVAAGHLAFQPLSNFRRIMEVNFFSTIRLQQALTPAVNACAGRVVFMSSVGGIVLNDGNGPYCASKTALEAYATILRVECYLWGTKGSLSVWQSPELSVWQSPERVCRSDQCLADVQVKTGEDTHPCSVLLPNVRTGVRNPPMRASYPDVQRLCGIQRLLRTTWNAMAAQDSTNANAWWRRVYTEEWLNGSVKYTQALLDAVAGDPQLAVDSMIHAVCAATPRISYMPGTNAGKRFFWQLWTMPESWACGRQYAAAAATAPKVVTAA
ncbi:hypothetical protein JKP88DRAFT_249589 [Tribonema minus]|uniref:Uncharacterized protein n=1 Tax=Tribonema minus TaxID=303371 RepID=A0A835YM47_9STRA|nr:hypothetical protein JKP88DRAFT_249589 [Tribonema minus]